MVQRKICCKKDIVLLNRQKWPIPFEGIDSSAVTPGMPIRSLTPTLLQSRRRYGTSSASSHSRTQLSSMESECCSSPRWEKDIQVRTAFFLRICFFLTWMIPCWYATTFQRLLKIVFPNRMTLQEMDGIFWWRDRIVSYFVRNNKS